nr:hypothetical protein [Ardenticatena sp.]
MSSSPLQYEVVKRTGRHPLQDVLVRIYITDTVDPTRSLFIEGPLGLELSYLMHSFIALYNDHESEFLLPTNRQPVRVTRLPNGLEFHLIDETHDATNWKASTPITLDHRAFLSGLSALVEDVLASLDDAFAEDDFVHILVYQWEQLWQLASRLMTGRVIALP